MSIVSFSKLIQGLMSNLEEHKSGIFLSPSLVLGVVSCFEGSLKWRARFWERRGFRVLITAEECVEVPAVLHVHWCLCLKRMLYVWWLPHLAWCGHAWCLNGKFKAGFVKKKKRLSGVEKYPPCKRNMGNSMDNAQLVLHFHWFVPSVSLCKPILAVFKIQEEEENDLKVGSEKHRLL